MPDFSLHELDLTDDTAAGAVHRIGRRAYTVEADLIGFDGIPALHESLESMRARPLHWLGATTTHDRQLTAFIAWQYAEGAAPDSDTEVDIDRVCVDPAWFRHGLATLLLRHLLTELAPGHTAMVSTGADNRPALALYERLGFDRTGTVEPVPGLRLAQFRRPAYAPRTDRN
ncbi:GNAT family N-acetyltransferase [Streptomyces sp. T-3]|nr:GNAT family N-acetyltransferase [Streptomyces sp. T-3]